jgi:hypothetical protein
VPKVPAKLHYIWIGGKPLPEEFQANLATWRRHNPGFEICAWNEANLDWSPRYMRAAYTFGYWSRVTNLARLQILKQHGGIYLDADVEMLRSLEPLRGNACFVGFQDARPNAAWVNGAVFGAVPGHWFVDACIARLLRCFTGVEMMDGRHGPGNVTETLVENGLAGYAEHGAMVRDVRIYPRAAFYPYHWTEAFDRAAITRETYLVHHWAASWVRGARKIPRPRGFARRVGDATRVLHERLQWQLRLWPAVDAFYRESIAAAAAAVFAVSRRAPD